MFFFQKKFSFENLQMLITMAQQVVLALEQTAQASGPEKKRMALHMLADLVKGQGLDPPQLLLDTVIEAAVRLTK